MIGVIVFLSTSNGSVHELQDALSPECPLDDENIINDQLHGGLIFSSEKKRLTSKREFFIEDPPLQVVGKDVMEEVRGADGHHQALLFLSRDRRQFEANGTVWRKAINR